MKRLVDLLLASIGLALTSPIFVVVAVLIKLEDGGPVFYRGTRAGRYGAPFRMWKFRTMVPDAESRGGPSAGDGDPRITRIGQRLRRYKLDEVPQFINVLAGQMSLVGPRPEVLQYVAMYSEEEKVILSVRPGVTDLATLWNSDEGAVLAASADPERTYLEKIRPTKIRLQLEYVRRQSFWADLVILWRTLTGLVVKTKPRAFETLDEETTR